MSERYRMTLAMLPAVIPPEHHDDIPVVFAPAIEAVRNGNPERIITWGPDPLDGLRARQIVAVFDLHGFVTEKDVTP